MKSLLILLLSVGLSSAAICANQKTFDTKLHKLLSPPKIYFEIKHINTISSIIFKEVQNCTTMEQIGDKLMANFMSYIPADKMFDLMAKLNNGDKCMKGCGSTVMDAVKKVPPAFYKFLEPAFKLLTTSIKQMRANKQPASAIEAKCYKQALSYATADIVTKIVKNCRARLTCGEWKCALEHLSALICIDKYDNAANPCGTIKPASG